MKKIFLLLACFICLKASAQVLPVNDTVPILTTAPTFSPNFQQNIFNSGGINYRLNYVRNPSTGTKDFAIYSKYLRAFYLAKTDALGSYIQNQNLIDQIANERLRGTITINKPLFHGVIPHSVMNGDGFTASRLNSDSTVNVSITGTANQLLINEGAQQVFGLQGNASGNHISSGSVITTFDDTVRAARVPVNDLDVANKIYVDGAITASSLTFNQGLTKSGSTVSWGSTTPLTGNVNINPAANKIEFKGNNTNDISNPQGLDVLFDNTDGGATVSIRTYRNVSTLVGQAGLNLQSGGGLPTSVSLQTIDNTDNSKVQGFSFDNESSPIVVTNSINHTAMQYEDHYALNDYSIPDVFQIDSLIAAAGGSGTVTSITPGVGFLSHTPIIATGTMDVDTAHIRGGLAKKDSTYNINKNLYDVLSKSTARSNLDVYSTTQTNAAIATVASTIPVGGNPTATAGLNAVNGTSLAWMRADAAPKIDSTVFKTNASATTDRNNLITRINVYTPSSTNVVTNKDLTSGTNTFPTFNQNTTGSAAKWTAPITINLSGVTATGQSIDGSGNVTIPVTAVPTSLFTGTLAAGQFPALTGDITTVAGALASTLKNTGTAGTYGQVTTDAQGRVSAGQIVTDIAHGGTNSATQNFVDLTTNQTKTGALTLQQNALGTSTTDAGIYSNITPAAVGAQQISPSLHFSSNGWGTTAGTSQDVSFRFNILPIQGATPTGNLQIQSSINGAAYANALTIGQSGFVTTTSGYQAGSTYMLIRSGLANVSTDGFAAVNNSVTTVGLQAQWPARIRLTGSAWNTTSTASNVMDGIMELQTSGGAVPSSKLAFGFQNIAAGGYTYPFSIDNSGNINPLSVNKVTITAPATSATLTIANGKTLTYSNSITIAGTDATTMTFPSTSAIIARTDAGNTFTGSQTVNGNVTLGTAGNKINITTGTNASVGTSTLVGGTVTVSTTAVTASSKIFLTDATTGALTNIGTPTVGTIVAGTSFVINSSNVLDTSNINWFIIN